MTTGTDPIYLQPDPFESFLIGQGHCVGDLVYLSGQASIDEYGAVVGENDIDTQINQVMLNVSRSLAAAGSGIERIFKVTIFLTDMSHFDRVMAMREKYFQPPWPADTTVGVAALALPELMIEIEVIATRA